MYVFDILCVPKRPMPKNINAKKYQCQNIPMSKIPMPNVPNHWPEVSEHWLKTKNWMAIFVAVWIYCIWAFPKNPSEFLDLPERRLSHKTLMICCCCDINKNILGFNMSHNKYLELSERYLKTIIVTKCWPHLTWVCLTDIKWINWYFINEPKINRNM